MWFLSILPRLRSTSVIRLTVPAISVKVDVSTMPRGKHNIRKGLEYGGYAEMVKLDLLEVRQYEQYHKYTVQDTAESA